MGIAVEPVEPCVDSDCYYSQGETLTWWNTPPQPAPPPMESVSVPPQKPAPLDTEQPTPPGQDIGLVSPPPVISSPSPSPSPAPSPSPTNPPAPTQDDPLYAIIGSLLQSRPNIPTGTQPVSVVQPTPVNPAPFVLVAVIAVIGLVAYGYISRTSGR